MKFCMVTTFFGAHSFGGTPPTSTGSRGPLIRRGHEVHVFHCVDAFNSVRGSHPLRPYTPPPGLHVHPLKSKFGILSPIATQMLTGRPFFKGEALREALDAVDTDVVHFHNISLVGGPGVLDLGGKAVRLMTAHEHWLICPMHLLWKYDRKPCDAADCVRCSSPADAPRRSGGQTGALDRGLQPARRTDLPDDATPSTSTAAGASARLWSTSPTSCPTTGPTAWKTPSPPRALAPTWRRPVDWSG